MVFTYPDTAGPQLALADTKNVLKGQCGTSGLSAVHGATPDYGVSWLLRTLPMPGSDQTPEVDHEYLVVEGDRVAMLSVSDDGDKFSDTSGDAAILAAMRDALAR
jgi:hypothetical protein